MVTNRRSLALVLIGTAIAFAACSLITDVDRSKIEGAGGTDDMGMDSGTDTGGQLGTGGKTSVTDEDASVDAGD